MNRFLDKKSEDELVCWHCTFTFDNFPLSMPFYYDSIKGLFKSKGYFCSFNCMKAYAFSNSFKLSGNCIPLIQHLHNVLTKNDKNKCFMISRSPPREALIKFGGTMSIEEFRKDHKCLYEVTPYPVIIIKETVNKKIDKEFKKNKSVALSDQRIEKAIQNVKNNRKKEIKSMSSKLSDFIVM